MAPANENTPNRRKIEGHHPDAEIAWDKPGAPVVPKSNTAGAARQGGNTILEGLTRYDYEPGPAGRMVFGQAENGEWIRFADVDRLLANAGAPAKLTDEDVQRIWDVVSETSKGGRLRYDFARAVESEVLSAHAGVKAEPAAAVQTALAESERNGLAALADRIEEANEQPMAIARSAARAIDKLLTVAAPVQAEQARVEPTRMSQRASFEHWYSDEGKSPKAVERDGEGYKLMGAQAAWCAWKACYAALDVTGRPSGPPSRALDAALPTQAEQVAAVRAALDDAKEGADILRNLIESIERHGNYTEESTVGFLNQALQCVNGAASALATKEAAAQVPAEKGGAE